MEKDNETEIESAEELAAEKDHLAEIKEDKVREEVIKEYGFDPDTDADRIEKAVKREMAAKKALSKAVGQKVKYRDGLVKAGGGKKDEKKDKKDDVPVDEAISKELDRRDLEEMEYPDEIKAAIKRIAEIEKIPVKKAEKDAYVVAKIEAWKKQTGADDAALRRKDNASGSGDGDDADLTPPKVDMTTEEGRKAYDAWKAKMKAAGN